jgi:PGF-pre-PGF domain-containing protein
VTVLDRAGNPNTTVLEYRVGVEAPLSDDNGTLTAAPTDPTVRNVTINVNGTIGNETVFVGTSQSNPEPVDPPDDVTLYFPQINVSVANANITDATVTVQVARSRVDATNADLDTVAFWVFESGSWNATTGTLVDEDATHLTYEVETPHFSTYAITADTVTTAGGGGTPGGDTGGDTGGDVPAAPSLSTSVSRLADGTVRLTVENTVVGETSSLAIEGGLVASGATFNSIDLTYAQDGERLEVDFRPHDSRPADVPELEQAVTVGYLTADTGVPDQTLDSVVFHFSVDESALPEGAGWDDVDLYRYDGSQWTELETTRQGTEFRATSPGFSVFAVGAATTDISVTAADLAVGDLVVGETAEVTVTLENDGTAQGSYTVDVLANDVTVATTEATVPAGGTETVTLSWTLESPGEYEVVVDEESAGTLVVQEDAADTGEPPTETPVAEGGGAATSEPPAGASGDGAPPTDLPGIALVALLVVLVVVALYVYRERNS